MARTGIAETRKAPAEPRLNLLGGFFLEVGDASVALPRHSRRVLAYLSVDTTSYGCQRSMLAERLWSEVDEDHSRASLRTALWRIRQASPRLLEADAEHVRIAPGVAVDVHRLRERADQIRSGSAEQLTGSARTLLGAAQLLPGWDETWLILAREQLRQTRLHALEAGAQRLRSLGRYAEAIELMLAVTAEEPLRESAHSALIETHVSEGNLAEARRQFDLFAAMLWDELGLRPTSNLFRLAGVPPPTATPAPVGVVRQADRRSRSGVSGSVTPRARPG